MEEQGELVSQEAAPKVAAERKGARRTGYQEPYAFYTERYRKGIRTIKRWAGEDAPLDEPERMPRWWVERHPAQKVPAGIEEALVEWRREHGRRGEEAPGDREAEPAEESEEFAEGAEGPEDADADLDEGEAGAGSARGLELEAAYRSLQVLRRKLVAEAHEPGRTKPYLDLVARMTKTAAELRKELKEWGRLKPVEQAEVEVASYGQAIGREVDGLYEDLCRLVGLPVNRTTEQKWLEVTRELRERLAKEVLVA